jgi:hypothetical protein
MAYFSSKSTWLSLVEGPESWQRGAGRSAIDPEIRPGACAPDSEASAPVTAGLEAGAVGFEESDAGVEGLSGHEDLEQIRQTRELRHRLFFQHQEWEFGPALLADLFKLARAETRTEEALAFYCQARHVAKTLVTMCDKPEFLTAWLESDRVIAELHHLLGNFDSCAVYAREGLGTIKLNKFEKADEMRITRLAIRFFQLLGRH